MCHLPFYLYFPGHCHLPESLFATKPAFFLPYYSLFLPSLNLLAAHSCPHYLLIWEQGVVVVVVLMLCMGSKRRLGRISIKDI